MHALCIIMFTDVYGFHVDAFLLIHVVIMEALLEGCLVYEHVGHLAGLTDRIGQKQHGGTWGIDKGQTGSQG